MSDPISKFTLSCPSSTPFYICLTSPVRFIGCCAINPCATVDGACPPQWVEPATFNASLAEAIPAQECQFQEPGVKFYKCSGTQPFIGCCAVDPCGGNGGCPVGEVRAARLSEDEGVAGRFLAGGVDTATRLSSSSLISSTRSTATSSKTSSRKSSFTSLLTTSKIHCKPPSTPSITSFTACTLFSSLTSTTSASSTNIQTTTSTSAAFVNHSDRNELSRGAVAGISVVSTIVGALVLGFIIFWIIRRVKRQPSDPNSSNEFLAEGADDRNYLFPHVVGSTGRPFTPPPSHYPPPRPYYLHEMPRSPQHKRSGSTRSTNSQHTRSGSYTAYPPPRPPLRHFPPAPYTRYINTPPFERTRGYSLQRAEVPTLLQNDFTHPRVPPVPGRRSVREDGLGFGGRGL